MMNRSILVHYSEIGIKGGNREYFERLLRDNLRRALDGTGYNSIRWLRGRFTIDLDDDRDPGSIMVRLGQVPGIAYFADCLRVNLDPELSEVIPAAVCLCTSRSFRSFRISARRSVKAFPLTSEDVNRRVGAAVQEATGTRVDLDNAELDCRIELVDRWAYIYTERREGLRGLPVGASGKVVSLISAGIDSPVAAHRMMRRGCRVHFVHFHSAPYTGPESVEQAVTLVRCISALQDGARLHLIAFAPVQQLIIASTPPPLRVILYRRSMVRLAGRVARRQGARALVTGESLGQVASQTLENLSAIQDAAELPILRPLIGLDKESIIREARTIGTFDTSIEPHDDCCSYLLPRRVETRADTDVVRRAEAETMDEIGRLEAEALDSAEIRQVKPVR